jgi:hypothetical protein
VHVSTDVDKSEDNHGPGCCLVECYVLVKWDK